MDHSSNQLQYLKLQFLFFKALLGSIKGTIDAYHESSQS